MKKKIVSIVRMPYRLRHFQLSTLTSSIYQFNFQLLLLLAAITTACSTDPELDGSAADGMADVRFTLNLPGTMDATRAITNSTESTVNSFQVLLFSSNKENGIYLGTAQWFGRTDMDGEVTFTVRLEAGTYDVVVLANAPGVLEQLIKDGDITPNVSTKKEVREALVLDENDLGDYIPLWGEHNQLTLTKGVAAPDLTIDLIRAMARIDVKVTASDFILTGVYLCNRSIRGALMVNTYDVTSWDATNKIVKKPTPPGGYEAYAPAQGASNAKLHDQGITNNKNLIGRIYTFEAPAGTGEPLTAARDNDICVVIKGKYNGTSTECFYRVDFVEKSDDDDDVYLPLLRNHRYEITISQVLYYGQYTLEEAIKASPKGVTVATVKTWGSKTVDSTLEGPYKLNVGRNKVCLPSTKYTTGAGADYLIPVSTDYAKGWKAQSDASSWLTVASSDTNGSNATSINTGSTLYLRVSANTSGSDRTGTITITAGKIRHVVQVTQRYYTGVKIFNSSGTAITELTFNKAYGTTKPTAQTVYVRWSAAGDVTITKATTIGASTGANAGYTVIEAVEWDFGPKTWSYGEWGGCEQSYAVQPDIIPAGWETVHSGKTNPIRQTVYTFTVSGASTTLTITHKKS